MNQEATEQEKTLLDRGPMPEKSGTHGFPSKLIYNPMLPWLKMMPNMQIEYQQVEVRLKGSTTHISGKRASYRDGVINQESIDVQGPAQLYFDAAQTIQNQMQSMMKMMFLPWAGLMAQRDLKSDKE